MATPRPITVYVAPASGGLFPVQLGMMIAVEAAHALNRAAAAPADIADVDPAAAFDTRPQIVLATSGGNIATYIALAGNWQQAGALHALQTLTTDSFLSKWAFFVPSWVFLPVEQALFRAGHGISAQFKSFFAPGALAAAPEVWTGVLHRATKQHRLATNKAEGDTLMTPRRIRPGGYDGGAVPIDDRSIFFFSDNEPPIYAAGDRDLIAAYSYASAAIPWIVKPVPIKDEFYCDGGTAFASPLTVAAQDLYVAITQPTVSVARLFYFLPHPLTMRFADTSMFAFRELASVLGSLSAIDVRTFAAVAERLGANHDEPAVYSQMNVAAIANLLRTLNDAGRAYAVLFCPHEAFVGLDLTRLSPRAGALLMEASQQNIDAVVWTA